MKRLIIVCEGPTEHEFCTTVLAENLLRYGIYVQAPVIKKSNGGIVPWSAIKHQIEMHLNEKDVHVTLLVDYYGIKDSYNFPGWMESKRIEDLTLRMHFLWDCMSKDINEQLATRFIPYIQLHEFESLLFSDLKVFPDNFDKKELDISILNEAVRQFPNPENINSRPSLAPSKRLMSAIKGYDKTVYGAYLASEIGLERIIEQCPLFSTWYKKLQSI